MRKGEGVYAKISLMCSCKCCINKDRREKKRTEETRKNQTNMETMETVKIGSKV